MGDDTPSAGLVPAALNDSTVAAVCTEKQWFGQFNVER